MFLLVDWFVDQQYIKRSILQLHLFYFKSRVYQESKNRLMSSMTNQESQNRLKSSMPNQESQNRLMPSMPNQESQNRLMPSTYPD
jgi:hypothetical protein